MPTLKRRSSPQPRAPKTRPKKPRSSKPVRANEDSSYMTGALSAGDDALYSMSSALPASGDDALYTMSSALPTAQTYGGEDPYAMSSALPAEQTSVDQAVSGGKRKCEKTKEHPSKKTCKRGGTALKNGKQPAQAAEPSGT
ncbi:hypothetical protein Hte_000120 [Hypoxylon texense]